MERILDKDLVSVQSYIDKFCGIYAESPFMRVNTPDGIRNVLYASLKTDVYALANAFLANGYTGRHIALISENRYEFFVVFFASLMAGVTFIPVNYAADPQKIADMLSFADTDILCATAKTAPLADAAASLCGRELIRLSLDGVDGSISYETLIGQGRDCAAQTYYGRFDSDETVLLCFTSGTSSGKPKCVELTAANAFTPATHTITRFIRCPDGKRFGQYMYTPLPLFHLAALISATVGCCIPNGNALTMSTGFSDCLRDIRASQPDFIFAVPALAQVICSMIDEAAKKLGLHFDDVADPSCNESLMSRRWAAREAVAAVSPNLKMFILCGAKTPVELEKKLFSFGLSVGNSYGLTECSPQITMDSSPIPKRVGTTGIPCSFNEAKTVDGVLYVRGENVMKGYYKNPDATKNVISPDGWFCTGDLAEIDSEGYVHINGRMDNIVVLSNGDNVDTDELSSQFRNADAIEEIVILTDKKNNGDTLAALIFPHPGASEASVKAAVDAINRTLPIHKRLMRFRLTDKPFEKNEMMKIKRYLYIKEEI